MECRIWVQAHSVSATGCKHILSILIITITYKYIFIFSLTKDNALNKASNPQILQKKFRHGEGCRSCVDLLNIGPLCPIWVRFTIEIVSMYYGGGLYTWMRPFRSTIRISGEMPLYTTPSCICQQIVQSSHPIWVHCYWISRHMKVGKKKNNRLILQRKKKNKHSLTMQTSVRV